MAAPFSSDRLEFVIEGNNGKYMSNTTYNTI